MPYPTDLSDPIRMIDRFGKWSIFIGVLLVLIGITGIVLPQVIALQLAYLIAILFTVGGIFWLAHVLRYSYGYWSDWFKPVALLICGLLLLRYPNGGIAIVGLLLVVYLLLDAFGSLSMAQALRPFPSWGWMAFNGLVSLALATLLLIGWPETTPLLIGLFVSISLFFDGLVLIYIGWLQRNMLK